MNMKLNALVIALSLAVSATVAAPAYALAETTTIDWSSHDTFEAGFGIVAAGNTFIDTYKFTLSNPTSILSSTVSSDLTYGPYSIFGISEGFVSLYNSDDIEVGSYSFDGDSVTYVIGTNLAAGSYYYTVSGSASGLNGGAYMLASAVPVPEAETWAMMMAGLGLVGLQLRRKSKVTSQIAVN